MTTLLLEVLLALQVAGHVTYSLMLAGLDRSTDSKSLTMVDALYTVDRVELPARSLNREFVVFSESWQSKILRPSIFTKLNSAKWIGRNGRDGLNLFVRSVPTELGRVTWSDYGPLAVLHIHFGKASIITSIESAERFVKEKLDSLFQFPSTVNKARSWKIKPIGNHNVYEGSVVQYVNLKQETLADGTLAQKPLEALRWYHYLTFVFD